MSAPLIEPRPSPRDSIARAFVDARRGGYALRDYPGAPPSTLAEAYLIQRRAISLYGERVAGWKVGRVPDPLVERYGSERLAGPIFAPLVKAAGEPPPVMPVFGHGFAAAEAEFLLRLGPLPDAPRTGWTDAEAAALVDRISIGIEIASSPFPGINDGGPAVTVSDFGNNHGLVIGPGLPADAAFLDWPVTIWIDDARVGADSARSMLDGPFGAVRFLLDLASTGAVTLAEGQWVSTGAITGVHPVRPGSAVRVRFGAMDDLHCRIGAITPGAG